MEIRLREIDETNWRDCIHLEVSDEQNQFLPSNLYSIAEARFEPGIKLMGIYKEDTMIGFASYILDEQGDMNLFKFMIDKNEQGKGYGKKALSCLIERIKNEKEYRKKEIWLSLHPTNFVAIKMYRDFGFCQEVTGLEAEDEIFFKYEF